jgi:outer membrane protein OmpA-like peptidoglycan-associated protein
MTVEREQAPARRRAAGSPTSTTARGASSSPFSATGRRPTPPDARQVLALQTTAGNAAVQRALAGPAGHREPAPAELVVSRFEGPEHRKLGDSTGATIDLGGGVVLTWGQVVAVAGDEYGSVEELRAAAATDEGRGRLLAALRHDGTADPVSVPWASDQQADAAKDKQGDEYLKLAAQNAVHFAEGGALAAWQDHHHRAITAAVNAGLGHNPAGLQDAYLVEGFGEHFLTDLYSAGHMRTPRAAILAWYTGVFAPRVADAMIASIKAKVTAAAVAQASPQLPGWVPNFEIEKVVGPKVSAKIDAVLADKLKGDTFAHALGLGVAGVISGMLHDKEGATGLMVSSEDHPEPWQAFGDGALEKSGPSKAQAEAALAAAKAEVDHAFAVGEAGAKERSAAPVIPPATVHFGFNSSALAGPNAAGVAAAAAHMRVHADAAVDVVGHTDPIGTDADNDALGLRRAEEVQRTLVGAGVEGARVRVSSAGEHQLLTRDPKRFSLDRRTDLIWRSDPSTPHGREAENDTATRRALEQADPGYTTGYPAITRFIPRPVEERGGSANAPIPQWHWGQLDAASRDAVDDWIRRRAGSNLQAAIAGMSLADIVEHVDKMGIDQDVTIQPKPIIQNLVDAFLAAPTKTLGDLAGEAP